MKIMLKRAYEAAAPGDGCRVLVDRLWPRGIAKADLPLDAWLKSATPSPALRTWFDHDPAKWAAFTQAYRAELSAAPEHLTEALSWCHRGPVSLIYAAKDRQHTHALILRDVLLETLKAEASHV